MLSHKQSVLIIVLATTLLASVWFHNGYIMGGGEAGITFYDLNKQLEVTELAWTKLNLGNSVGIGVGSFPTYWVLAILQNIGIPGFIIQAIFFSSLFIVSGISIYFLIKVLFPDTKPTFALLGVFFYWLNPISLVNVWNRSLENYRVFWAFLPLFLLLYLLGIKRKRYLFALIIGLTSGIFSYALTAIPFNVLLMGLSVYTSIFYFLTDKTVKEKVFDIAFPFLTLICIALINFWWISQLFSFIFSPDSSLALGKFYQPEGNLYTLSVESQLLGQWPYIFRLLHKVFFTEGLIWAKPYSTNFLGLLEFAIPVLIFWCCIKYRKLKEVVFLGILWIMTMFLIRGNQFPFGGIFEFFFMKFFVLQAFRNPFEKFGFLLPLATAPLFAFMMQKISDNLTNVIIRKFIVSISFLYVVVLWGFPFWTGLVFTRTKESGSSELVSYEVKVPDYYNKVNEWMNSQGRGFRFVSLPLGGEGMSYNWTRPYSGVELSSLLIDTPNISFNTSIPYFTEISSYLSDYQSDKRILDFLPFINGRFIVLRRDIGFKERNLPNPKDAEMRFEQWVKEGLLTKKYQEGELVVYEVDKNSVWPKIYITPQIITSNEDNLSQFRGFVEGFPRDPLAIVDFGWLGANQIQNRLLKPTKVFSSSNNSLAELTFRLPISGSDFFVSYSFNIPFSGKYKMSVNGNWADTRWFLDGKELNVNQQDEINLIEGLHELASIGKESDFLLPIISANGFSVSDSNQYKQKFDLPSIPANYQLDFDYMFTSNSIFTGKGVFSVNLLEDIDNSTSPVFSGRLVQNNLLNTWSRAKSTIRTKGGASSAELQIFLLKESKSTQSSVAIQNLRIRQIKYPEPVLVSSLPLKSQQSTTILKWEKIDPTEYKIKIRKQDEVPEVMVFSELFNSDWKLYQDGRQINGNKHFLVNAYANGWLFDKPGSYDLILEFIPQKLLYIGEIISALSFIILFLYSLYFFQHNIAAKCKQIFKRG